MPLEALRRRNHRAPPRRLLELQPNRHGSRSDPRHALRGVFARACRHLRPATPWASAIRPSGTRFSSSATKLLSHCTASVGKEPGLTQLTRIPPIAQWQVA